jgi:hypothetical protein
MANPRRYARDLLADRDLCFISRTFPLWVGVGLAVPFGLGVALTGSIVGGLTGLLWGGAVRVLLLHHATFSINSLCHFIGHRPFATGDESRTSPGWHQSPSERRGTTIITRSRTSAQHGLGRWQLDPSAWLITALERCHLAWDVVRISPTRQQTKGSGFGSARTRRTRSCPGWSGASGLGRRLGSGLTPRTSAGSPAPGTQRSRATSRFVRADNRRGDPSVAPERPARSRVGGARARLMADERSPLAG